MKLQPEIYFLIAALIGSAVFGLGIDSKIMTCAMPGLVLAILAMFNYIVIAKNKEKNK